MIRRHRDGRHGVEVPATQLGHVGLVALTYAGVRLLEVPAAEVARDWRSYESDEVRAAFLIAASARFVGTTPEAWDALASIVELPEGWKPGALQLGEVRARKEEKAAKKAAKKPRKSKAKKEPEPQQEAATDEDHSSGVQSREW